MIKWLQIRLVRSHNLMVIFKFATHIVKKKKEKFKANMKFSNKIWTHWKFVCTKRYNLWITSVDTIKLMYRFVDVSFLSVELTIIFNRITCSELETLTRFWLTYFTKNLRMTSSKIISKSLVQHYKPNFIIVLQLRIIPHQKAF